MINGTCQLYLVQLAQSTLESFCWFHRLSLAERSSFAVVALSLENWQASLILKNLEHSQKYQRIALVDDKSIASCADGFPNLAFNLHLFHFSS